MMRPLPLARSAAAKSTVELPLPSSMMSFGR